MRWGAWVLVAAGLTGCAGETATDDSSNPDCSDQRDRICDCLEADPCSECVERLDYNRPAFYDDDQDGFGGESTYFSCPGWADGDFLIERGGDCDDEDARAYPGAEEVCDEVDNDCDGVVDVPACDAPLSVLVFSETRGFRHGSIENGLAALGQLAIENDWELSATEDSAELASMLDTTDVVVFLSPTGDVLEDDEQIALEAFVRDGGGWVGVHAAGDCEYGWDFYGELVGAWFERHPSVQEATLTVEIADHPATVDLPSPWIRTDEWYDFQTNPRDDVDVLLTIDESSYSGGGMGDDHPIAWSQSIDSGRALYTALGHTASTFDEPAFRAHLAGAIRWASGE